MLRVALLVFTLLIFSGVSESQVPQSAQPANNTAASGAPSPVDSVLQQLQQTAQTTNSDLSRLRVDRWKADSGTKQQAQEMASSVSRNLNSALPELIQAARTQPASLASQFKLYHNVTALYETLASLTETTGAFGARPEYDALSGDTSRLDAQRRSLADYLQNLAAQNDADLARFRAAAARAAAAAATPAPAPKKIVVDDDSASGKPASTAKKKPATKKPAATTPAPQQQQPPQ